ncbi:fungal hydrophobin [Mycena leptocephala]|nr:fungal hydrophobin [Mycena leptocephala]
MFSKLSVVVTSVLITLAAAMPWDTPPHRGFCLTGLDVPVGLSCSPITVVGNNCGSTTVTCDAPENEWGGLIAINCIPITA